MVKNVRCVKGNVEEIGPRRVRSAPLAVFENEEIMHDLLRNVHLLPRRAFALVPCDRWRQLVREDLDRKCGHDESGVQRAPHETAVGRHHLAVDLRH